MTELKVLISREKIAHRVAELGAEITRDFAGKSVLFVGVLKGAAIFLSDLARKSIWMPPSTLLASRVTAIAPARRRNCTADGTRPAKFDSLRMWTSRCGKRT